MKRKKWILPLVALMLLGLVSSYPQQGQAQTELDKINAQLDSLRKSKAEAEQIQKNANNEIARVQKDRTQTKIELDQLNAQIDQVASQLTEIQTKMDKTQLDLQKAGDELQQAIDRVAARDKLLKTRIRGMYTNGSVSYLDVLLNATSFSDLWDRMDALKAIVGQDQDILAKNKQDRDLIAQKKVQVEKQLAEVKDLYSQTAVLQQQMLVKEKQKQVQIASLDKKQQNLEDVTQAQQQEMIRLASEISKALQKQKNFKPVYKGGKLGWPLAKDAPETSGFGSRIDPLTGKRGAFHNGLDFGAPAGTDVLAAEGGMVVMSGWYGGFGNAVIIEHGGGLKTLYGHMKTNSVIVDKGDMVKRGQKIGEVGSTGRSTGNHLHFTVYSNDEAVDPTSYLNLK